MADRYAPPEKGLPLVESVCVNGHHWAGEIVWRLPLVFTKDLPLTANCPDCNEPLFVKAGSYERDPESDVYLRTGPPDPAIVESLISKGEA